jgi:hypothetical protein
MTYVYYIDGEKLTTDDYNKIPRYKYSSPDENTPAWENLITGEKIWCLKGNKFHRLTGPATNWSYRSINFWLNGKYYENIHYWLKAHPNQDNTFQVEILLKYS